MTLLSNCYCTQASWLEGLVFRGIESFGHTGIKCQKQSRRSPGNQRVGKGDEGGPPCVAGQFAGQLHHPGVQ